MSKEKTTTKNGNGNGNKIGEAGPTTTTTTEKALAALDGPGDSAPPGEATVARTPLSREEKRTRFAEVAAVLEALDKAHARVKELERQKGEVLARFATDTQLRSFKVAVNGVERILNIFERHGKFYLKGYDTKTKEIETL